MRMIVNSEISIEVPEGFSEMTEAEIREAYRQDYSDRWAIRDSERHIIICIQWHKNNALMASLADPESLIKNFESKISKAMKDNSYSLIGFGRTELCGIDAPSFRHTYQVEGVDQTSEVCIFKHGKVVYTVYSYYRTGDALAEDTIQNLLSTMFMA